jgi:hypothetical protein
MFWSEEHPFQPWLYPYRHLFFSRWWLSPFWAWFVPWFVLL